jgi:hypothetical protein
MPLSVFPPNAALATEGTSLSKLGQPLLRSFALSFRDFPLSQFAMQVVKAHLPSKQRL